MQVFPKLFTMVRLHWMALAVATLIVINWLSNGSKREEQK